MTTLCYWCRLDVDGHFQEVKLARNPVDCILAYICQKIAFDQQELLINSLTVLDVELVKNNARIAADIAVNLYKLSSTNTANEGTNKKWIEGHKKLPVC